MDDTLRSLLLTAADRAEEIGDPLLGLLKIAASGQWPARLPNDTYRQRLLARVRSMRSRDPEPIRLFGERVDFTDPLLCEVAIRIMAPRYLSDVEDRLGVDMREAQRESRLQNWRADADG